MHQKDEGRMMIPKFNVGDKVLYKSNTGQDHVCTICTIKQMYTISNDHISATVDETFISKYVQDLSDVPICDIVIELESRGFTSIELTKDFDMGGYTNDTN